MASVESYYIKRCGELNIATDSYDFKHEIDHSLSYTEAVDLLEQNYFSKVEDINAKMLVTAKHNKERMKEKGEIENLKEEIIGLQKEFEVLESELKHSLTKEQYEKILDLLALDQEIGNTIAELDNREQGD